jgi:hypothetical protein
MATKAPAAAAAASTLTRLRVRDSTVNPSQPVLAAPPTETFLSPNVMDACTSLRPHPEETLETTSEVTRKTQLRSCEVTAHTVIDFAQSHPGAGPRAS